MSPRAGQPHDQEPNPFAPPGPGSGAPWAPPAPQSGPWGPPPPAPPGWALPPSPPGPGGYSPWGPAPAFQWSSVPPRRGLGASGIALLTLVIVLISSAAGIAIQRHDEIAQRRAERLRAQIRAELPALQAFVEKERGLRFIKDVDVRLLDDDDFLRRINEGGGEDISVPSDDEPAFDPPSTLFALGLIDSVDEYYEAAGAAIDDSVQGFYEFESKQLVIRGGALNPLTRLVIVHELTHALQDQHFDLEDRDFGTADEEQVAFTALVEGDANRVDAAYREQLPAAEKAQLDEIESDLYAGFSLDGPEVIYTLLGFPYAVGPDFVAGVLEAGKQPALDKAFREPPTTTEQILHPDEYVTAPEPATRVDRPGVAGKLIDEGVLGELGLIVILSEGGTEKAGSAAVHGWAGDYYATYRNGDETCVRADILMETPKDRDELFTALERWADGDGEVTKGGELAVRLERCAD